jgi:hypothetical protein
VSGRLAAQASVETALAALLFGIVLGLGIAAGFWALAQNVTTAAAQEAARVASAQGGDLEHGVSVGTALLQAGLGPSSRLVELTASEDAAGVTVIASGGWPLWLGPGTSISLPLHAEVHMLRDRWTP